MMKELVMNTLITPTTRLMTAAMVVPSVSSVPVAGVEGRSVERALMRTRQQLGCEAQLLVRNGDVAYVATRGER